MIKQQDKGQIKNQDINVVIIEEGISNKKKDQYYPFNKLRSTSINIFEDSAHIDDGFKVQPQKSTKHIILRRMIQIYPQGTPLFPQQTNKFLQKILCMHKPSYISQIQMLPIWHYRTLIRPLQINPKGFYQIVVWKQGRMVKQPIDDFIQYDKDFLQALIPKQLVNQPWIQIILKVWAKLNGGYQKLYNCQPFTFIKTFSYPDWQILNPHLQSTQFLINKLSKVVSKQKYFLIKTKDNLQIGQYGFLPNCSSYIITGYYQSFGDIFIKIKSYVYSNWNKKCSDNQISYPQQQLPLDQDQFYLPYKQFLNIFSLIYCTHNKYDKQQKIYYNKYNLNLDARQSKAKMLTFQMLQQGYLGINTYFPTSRSFDLSYPHNNNKNSQNSNNLTVIPYCKILLGKQNQNINVQASFVQSVKKNLIQNQDGDFLSMKSLTQYQWIKSDYFKGYHNQVTYLLRLKPGRYYLRYKIQQMKAQYRCIINTVSNQQVVINDAKLDKRQQIQFIHAVLSSKARIQKRNITYINPIKKGSWVIVNDDFDTVGYGSIVAHAIKNSEHKIIVQIDPKKLKQNGYYIKGKKDQIKFNKTAQDGQTFLIIVKKDLQFTKERVWLPPGIEIFKILRKSS